jgi:hypothetical protein
MTLSAKYGAEGTTSGPPAAFDGCNRRLLRRLLHRLIQALTPHSQGLGSVGVTVFLCGLRHIFRYILSVLHLDILGDSKKDFHSTGLPIF